MALMKSLKWLPLICRFATSISLPRHHPTTIRYCNGTRSKLQNNRTSVTRDRGVVKRGHTDRTHRLQYSIIHDDRDLSWDATESPIPRMNRINNYFSPIQMRSLWVKKRQQAVSFRGRYSGFVRGDGRTVWFGVWLIVWQTAFERLTSLPSSSEFYFLARSHELCIMSFLFYVNGGSRRLRIRGLGC